MYKVLIVEDEDIIRKGLSYKFNWLKYNCIVVGSAIDGIDGIAKIAELLPDIVITDIRMPFKDGIEMLKQSKGKYEYEAIILSGYSEFEYAQQAISLGVSEYLLKPIDFTQLDEAMKKIVNKLDEKANVLNTMNSSKDLQLYNEILDLHYYHDHNQKNKHVERMLDYIKNNYAKKISLSDISEELQVSTVYLNSKFKEGTQYTFNDFLNRYRILKAVELLRQGDNLIYEVAEQVGFNDYKYFSQVFKKYVGTSPSDFV